MKSNKSKSEVKSNFEKVKTLLKENWGPIVLAIFIIILLSLILAYNLNENFADEVRSKLGSIGSVTVSKNLEDLDVIFFMNPECPHCKKQLDIFQKEGSKLNVIDVSTEEGQKQATVMGIPGVPFFISRKYNTSTIGTQTTEQLVNSLQPKQQNQQQQNQEQNNIVVLTREGCGYCTKAKEDLKLKNIKDVVVMEASSPEAKKIVEKFNINYSGVPLYVNILNGKYNEGFMPIEQIKNKLK